MSEDSGDGFDRLAEDGSIGEVEEVETEMRGAGLDEGGRIVRCLIEFGSGDHMGRADDLPGVAPDIGAMFVQDVDLVGELFGRSTGEIPVVCEPMRCCILMTPIL